METLLRLLDGRLYNVLKPPGARRLEAHAIYHNHTGRVDLATLDALARALGCEPGELIGKAKRAKA